MKIIINNLNLSLNDDLEILNSLTVKKLNIKNTDIKNFRIIKESIDARNKNNIRLIYSVMAEVDDSKKILTDNDAKILQSVKDKIEKNDNKEIINRPIVVGSGPAGLWLPSATARRRVRSCRT